MTAKSVTTKLSDVLETIDDCEEVIANYEMQLQGEKQPGLTPQFVLNHWRLATTHIKQAALGRDDLQEFEKLKSQVLHGGNDKC